MAKNFCPLASNHIEVNAVGHFKPCCISSKKFEVGGEVASADTFRITDVVNSEDRQRGSKTLINITVLIVSSVMK